MPWAVEVYIVIMDREERGVGIGDFQGNGSVSSS